MKNKMSIRKFHSKYIGSNKGFTMVEMIVTFLLLSIFLVCAATIIGYISQLYYHVKGETYSKQVSDILIEKAVSEIDGAKYKDGDVYNNPKLDDDNDKKVGSSISMYDKTDTRVKLYVDYGSDGTGNDGQLCINYAEIQDASDSSRNRNATTWRFSNEVYNGFYISDFKLVRGDALDAEGADIVDEYGLTGDMSVYDKSVMVIFMTLYSDKYGEYKCTRFVKMYNVN